MNSVFNSNRALSNFSGDECNNFPKWCRLHMTGLSGTEVCADSGLGAPLKMAKRLKRGRKLMGRLGVRA